MQKGHQLEFNCLNCQEPVQFSVFELEKRDTAVACNSCQKKYILEDETLRRQLRKFEALCQQIIESEEILGDTSVGIDVGSNHVKIPYKLLMTRLNTSLSLILDDQPVSIVFRLEPQQDLEKLPTA